MKNKRYSQIISIKIKLLLLNIPNNCCEILISGTNFNKVAFYYNYILFLNTIYAKKIFNLN